MKFKEFIIHGVKEHIIKKPLILIFLFVLCLGLVFWRLGAQIISSTPQDIISDIFIFLCVLIILFSALATYLVYKKNQRPFDSAIVPIFFSVFFICMTLILILFFGMFKEIYIQSVEMELNHIAFPLAIFALGITLYYFFESQFSTDKKLDSIIKFNQDNDNIKKNEQDISNSITNEKPKDYHEITEEDKLIFEHLSQRHNNLLLFIDALDTKYSQIIALNGLILSFFLIKKSEVANIYVFFLGLSLILVTICIGIHGYRSREYLTGANKQFFELYDTYLPGIGITKLKNQLLADIEVNTEIQNQKAEIFDKMLIVNFIALILVIFGYYV